LPDLVPIPEPAHVNLDAEPLKLSGDSISSEYARTLVIDSMNLSERYRSNNHDRRWKINNQLYFGFVPQRFWDGTKIARASVGLPLTFDQIHAVKPFINSALFGTAGDWFQVEAIPGESTMQEAEAQKSHLMYSLEHPTNNIGGSAVNELKLSIHQTLMYGNGGAWLQYDPQGNYVCCEWVDMADIYVDPNAPTPDIESARYVIYRKLMTVDELDKLRDSDGMMIPGKDMLYTMANSRPVTFGDFVIQSQETLRGMSYNPATDGHVPMPADRYVEVLMYYSKSRVVWVLDRKWVAFNEMNELGFYPFIFAPCYTVPGRFYAQGIPDVQEGNQRVCEALMNGRLDEITLSLNPPRIRKRGSMLTPSQLRVRPGQMLESDTPDADFIRQQPQQITTNVYQELGFFENAAEKRTGISGAATSGAIARSNASRTTSGVNAQTQGPLSRISEIVDNVESYLIIPMLYKMGLMMDHYNGEEGQEMKGLTGEQLPGDTFRKRVRFKVLAASKMLTREKLAQEFPFIIQYLFSGPFMAEMQKTGRTVDFDGVFKMFQDATGTANSYSLVRAMTPQEQQMLNQPPPQAQMQMQMKQSDQQTRKDIADKKAQVELTKAAMSHKSSEAERQDANSLIMLDLLAKANAGALMPPPAGPGDVPQG
jgi:hypothetical protein